MSRLFHFVSPQEWLTLERLGSAFHSPASLTNEGFVHLSFEHQLAGTLAAHFATWSQVLVLEVVLDDKNELRVEPSRGGEDFPHLYRPLRRSECVRRYVLERRGDEWNGLAAVHAGADPDFDSPPDRP